MGSSLQGMTSPHQIYPQTSSCGWPRLEENIGYYTSNPATESEASRENRPPSRTSTFSYRSSSSVPRKDSVDTLVHLFETRDRLSRAPTKRITRTGTIPSDVLKRKYTSALNSRKQTFCEHNIKRPPLRNTFRPEDLDRVDTALRSNLADHSTSAFDPPATVVIPPSNPHSFTLPALSRSNSSKLPTIRIITTSRSVALHIPEGVQLPITTSIHSAAPFETHMSLSRSRSDSVPESTSKSEERSGNPRSRAATVQDLTIETVKETSEPQTPTPGNRPKLKEVRRGILSISEVSAPLPQSSPVVAAGELFGPQPGTHSRTADEEPQAGQADHQEEVLSTHPPGKDEEVEENARPGPVSATDRQSGHLDEHHPRNSEGETLQAALKLVHQEDHTEIKNLGQLSPVLKNSVPAIQVHRPSDAEATMAALGTGVINAATGNTPSTPVLSVLDSAAPAATSVIASPDGLPVNPPVSPSAPLDAVPADLPIDVPDVAVPDVQVPGVGVPGVPPLGVSNIQIGGKLKRRKKVVRKARKVILRKRVLAIILGKELAGTVHPLLNAAGGAAAPVDVPVSVPAVPV